MATATASKIPFPFCDMHSHLLPGVDDGCKTAEESLALLRQSAAQGIDGVFVTPHFYPERSLSQFLSARGKALETLRAAVPAGEALPPIRPGAEVAYYPGLQDIERLPSLCLGNTPFLLLGLPFYPWSRNLLRDVEALQSYFGIRLVIAHVDRYLDSQDGSLIRQLLDSDVYFQMNAEAVLSPHTARKARRLLKDGYISFLGSDCHDPERRRQLLGEAVDKICSWRMEETVRAIGAFSCQLFER